MHLFQPRFSQKNIRSMILAKINKKWLIRSTILVKKLFIILNLGVRKNLGEWERVGLD